MNNDLEQIPVEEQPVSPVETSPVEPVAPVTTPSEGGQSITVNVDLSEVTSMLTTMSERMDNLYMIVLVGVVVLIFKTFIRRA